MTANFLKVTTGTLNGNSEVGVNGTLVPKTGTEPTDLLSKATSKVNPMGDMVANNGGCDTSLLGKATAKVDPYGASVPKR